MSDYWMNVGDLVTDRVFKPEGNKESGHKMSYPPTPEQAILLTDNKTGEQTWLI